ncbi:Protein N-acetyltransferase, RimJ/RimL family [Arthrobacter sp. ov407]|uniref:GNAT family N-acetyltransferase n=1 Tax=Arthrobacter sp. ov407 TaxID=1761748 RepID=UPI00088A9567|nr:Protein N-acetyltransferase, RimJ/RimL family [Arthrobacter sp. ov407]
MELQTERLLLRDYTLDDSAAVHSFASDVRIAEYVEWGPNTADDTREFLELCVAAQRGAIRTNFTLAVTLPSGDPFGSVGLAVDRDRGELGYVIDADHWGRGYATEAAASLLRFGKETLRLRDITATCRPENSASARVLEKIGMLQVGLRRADKLIRGQWRDSLVFSAVSTSDNTGPAQRDRAGSRGTRSHEPSTNIPSGPPAARREPSFE